MTVLLLLLALQSYGMSTNGVLLLQAAPSLRMQHVCVKHRVVQLSLLMLLHRSSPQLWQVPSQLPSAAVTLLVSQRWWQISRVVISQSMVVAV